MLITKMEIRFYKNAATLGYFHANSILRPAFNFGQDLLFSGTIIYEGSTEKYLVLKDYIVGIDFSTITNEAYTYIKSSIEIGMYLNIQLASKVIGEARMIDFVYVDDES